MPEEAQAPALEQDQPNDSAPAVEDGTSAEQVEEKFSDIDLSELPDEITPDFLRERYEQMQGDYTKKTQSLAEQRREAEKAQAWVDALSNPDTQDQALAALGIELVTDDEEPEDDDDEEEFRDPRVDGLIAEREQEQRAHNEALLDSHIDELAKAAGLELTARQKKAIHTEAVAEGFSPETTIKVFAGWQADLEQYGEAVTKRYRESKKAPSPPIPPGGSGTAAADPMDRKARLERAEQVAAQHTAP